MKILSLNLHCYAEANPELKQAYIADFIKDNQIDVCFFQEVAQSFDKAMVKDKIKEDNYAYLIQNLLKKQGLDYDLYYNYSKRGFGIYDEGLGILSKSKLSHKKSYYVSKGRDYHDWHTRMNVSCETFVGNTKLHLTSVHFGWTEGNEVFEDQFNETARHLDPNQTHIMAGDFNISEESDEYRYITKQGWIDLYGDSEHFHDVTHLDYIDVKKEATRIDYVFSNKDIKVKQREIVFKEVRVSDHFGVFIELDLEEIE
jgi:maltose 6'-phosphate phosphatase